MNKDKKHIALLNQIAATEGEGFQYDDERIQSEYDNQGGNSPKLAITVLTILGGILATILFTAFILILGFYKSGSSLLVLGLVFISAAIWINIILDSLILNTFSISSFIIGYVLIGAGLMEMGNYDNGIALTFMTVSLISLFLTQNQLISMVAIIMGIGSTLSLIVINDLFPLWHVFPIVLGVWVYLHYTLEVNILHKRGRYAKLYNPLRIGLILSFLFALELSGDDWFAKYAATYDWISSPIIIALVLLVGYKIIQLLEIRSKTKSIIILIGAALVLSTTAFAPGIAGSLLVLLLSFKTGHKTGFAVGLIAFIYFISRFYYDMDISLLYKSMLMITSGILFLIFFYFTHKKIGDNEKI